MGEIADEIVDRLIFGGWDRRPRRMNFQTGAGKGMWRDATGQCHSMKDMTVAHLRSAIAKCRKEGNTGKLADLEKEFSSRVGDYFSPVDNA